MVACTPCSCKWSHVKITKHSFRFSTCFGLSHFVKQIQITLFPAHIDLNMLFWRFHSYPLVITSGLKLIIRRDANLCSLDDVAEGRTPPGPGVVRGNVGWDGFEWSVVCVELARLVRRTSPLPAWTHESRECWVSCVLSWHVLSEGQVHYQRGHTSLECVECRVCWAGISRQKDKFTTSVVTPVWSVLSVVCVELARLVRRTSPLPAWSHESIVCWAGMSCQKDKSTTSEDTWV